MKKLLFILITFLSLSAFSQGTQGIPKYDTLDAGTVTVTTTDVIQDTSKGTIIFNNVDSLKDVAMAIGATISNDSVMVVGKDGIIVISKENLQKPTGKNMWEWLTYIIFFVGILFVIIISSLNFVRNLSFIKDSKNILIQRVFSQTSNFMKKAQIFAGTIGALGTSILVMQGQIDLLTPNLLGTIQTITIVSLAIAGGAIFTSKNPNHTK